MNTKKIAETVKNKERWVTVRTPQDNSHSIAGNIRVRNAYCTFKLARELRRWKIASVTLSLLFALLFVWFARRSSGNTLVYVNTKQKTPVLYTADNKKIPLRYDAEKKLYVAKMKTPVSKIKPSVPIAVKKPVSPSLSVEKTQYNKSGSNNDNQPDGPYVPGLENELLASANLDF